MTRFNQKAANPVFFIHPVYICIGGLMGYIYIYIIEEKKCLNLIYIGGLFGYLSTKKLKFAAYGQFVLVLYTIYHY